MIRGLSGLTVLLLIGVLFLGGTLLMCNQRPKSDNPEIEAQQAMLDELGFEADLYPDKQQGGLAVLKVTPGSRAEAAGLHVGDLVLAVNEASVWDAIQLQEELDKAQLQRVGVRLMVKNKGMYRTLILGGTASHSAHPARQPSPAPTRAGG